MPSNSDTIYHALCYIKSHPGDVIFNPNKYNNALQMFVDDSVEFGNTDIFFPDQKLEVNRMSLDFLTSHNQILDYFYDKTDTKVPNYKEVWITTSHLVKDKKYLVDISFE